MKNSIFLFVLLTGLISSGLYGQNPIWSLTPHGADFGPPLVVNSLPTPLTGVGYDGLPATNASNAMQDANGDLLFFIVDNMIYDKEGFLIGDLSVEFYNPNGYPQNLRQNILFSYNLFLSINLHKPLTHYLTICNLTIHASAAVALLRII